MGQLQSATMMEPIMSKLALVYDTFRDKRSYHQRKERKATNSMSTDKNRKTLDCTVERAEMGSRRNFLLTTGAALAVPPLELFSHQRRIGGSKRVCTLPERRGFKTIDTVWVPMKDGTRIALRLWLPDGAE